MQRRFDNSAQRDYWRWQWFDYIPFVSNVGRWLRARR